MSKSVKSSRRSCAWNLLDTRDLLRQKKGKSCGKIECEIKEITQDQAKMEGKTEAKPKGVNIHGTVLGRKPTAWDKKAENAIPAKLLGELNEKVAEKRLEFKKRNKRATDEEIKAAMEVVLDKNHDKDTGVATLATMEIKAEIGRRLVAQRTANVDKQNLVTNLVGLARDPGLRRIRC